MTNAEHKSPSQDPRKWSSQFDCTSTILKHKSTNKSSSDSIVGFYILMTTLPMCPPAYRWSKAACDSAKEKTEASNMDVSETFFSTRRLHRFCWSILEPTLIPLNKINVSVEIQVGWAYFRPTWLLRSFAAQVQSYLGSVPYWILLESRRETQYLSG